MLYGIADISRRVEYPETRQKAIRNIFFVGAFNVFYLVLMLPGNIFESDKSFFMTLLLILNVMYVVMNAWLLFKCYAMICPAGQEDMQRKRSRFEFINKLHEMQDEREQRVIDGTKEYFENKLKQRNEKLKSKQSGSKSNKRKKKK
jgi:biopolymer transport protein ExbB/TolQ